MNFRRLIRKLPDFSSAELGEIHALCLDILMNRAAREIQEQLSKMLASLPDAIRSWSETPKVQNSLRVMQEVSANVEKQKAKNPEGN